MKSFNLWRVLVISFFMILLVAGMIQALPHAHETTSDLLIDAGILFATVAVSAVLAHLLRNRRPIARRPALKGAPRPARRSARPMTAESATRLSKVPAVTLGFWIIKIAATTLGETGGDAVSMTMELGYAISSIIFIGILAAAVAAQIRAKKFHPFLYWFVIVATTTAGTTLADFADRSLGIGYLGGSSILLVLVIASLGVWYRSAGSISVDTVATPKIEMFYWGTILFSQTLGTALGDWVADTNDFGFERGALVFAAALAVVAAGYFFTKISRTLLFWAAFILTRPLGATIGDLLDKPVDEGGFAVSRIYASLILAAFMIACILLMPQRAGKHPGSRN